MTNPQWTVLGLLLALAGVILLFRYGMPYRVRTGGNKIEWTSINTDPEIVRDERCHAVLGWIGLTMVVLGTGAQIVGALV